MQPASLYNMPLRSRGACSLEPSQRIKIRNIAIAAVGLVSVTYLAFFLYDEAISLSTKSIKPMDRAFKIAELVLACIGSLYACGIGAALFRTYQAWKERIPNMEAYQGSLAGDLLELVSSPNIDQFNEKTWGPFLSDFMNQFEPVLLDRYFLLQNVAPDKRIEHFRKELNLGCCKGYTLALFAEMKKNSKLASAELKDAIKIENVVYYQLVYMIICSLIHSELMLYPIFHYYYKKDYRSISFKQYLDAAEFVGSQDQHILEAKEETVFRSILLENLNRMMKHYSLDLGAAAFESEPYLLDYCNLSSKGTLFYESDTVDNFESIDNPQLILSEFLEKGDKALCAMKKGMDLAISGCIEFYFTNSQEKQSAHGFFFQCSEGIFRFTDSGVLLRNFFEFDTKESLIAGLSTHLKKCYGHHKNIKLKLILLALPKEEEI